MLLNSIKIGIAVGAFAVTALTVTDLGNPYPDKIRIPESIDQSAPVSLQMYKYIKQYADSFDIPKKYAFGIANTETGYNGPFHWKYNPALTSSAGAVGPMQVMVSTARWINKDDVSKDRLRTDIEYNIFTSMKLLRILQNKNHDWKVTFGEYNTGRPCINSYSHKVYNFKPKW